MAKNALADWDTTAANNTDVGGISIAEGMAPANVNNAMREIMAQLATYTAALAADLVPIGTIVLWSGSVASIPTNWALCDGTGGTVNLENRFVVGAGDAYAVGDTGGANNVTLTTEQMPVHTHTGSAASAGAHTHGFPSGSPLLGLQAGGVGGSTNLSYGAGGNTSLDAATASAGAHTHTLTINNAGSGSSHENRPPYYALAYIQKVS